MEEDRAETNLGQSANADLHEPKVEKPKQPRKRFVGRRTADQAANANGTKEVIEESGAIQGLSIDLAKCNRS